MNPTRANMIEPTERDIGRAVVYQRQDTFTLPEGQVVLQWPSSISPDDYKDLKVWLGLMARTIKQSVATPTIKENTQVEGLNTSLSKLEEL